jgi:hypothetical protein
MRTTRILLVLALSIVCFAAIFTTGCTQYNSSGYTEASLQQSSWMNEAYQTDQLQKEYDKDLPEIIALFKKNGSLERQGLIERLKRLNTSNKIGYVYCLSYGKVMAQYTIKGKVMSPNSMLTQSQQVVAKKGYMPPSGTNNADWTTLDQFVVDSPDLNGSYGPNAPEGTVFFFTTSGALVDWHGDYIYSDRPMTMTTPPELVMPVK